MSTRRSLRNQKKTKPTTSSSDTSLDKYLVVSQPTKRKQSWLTPPEQAEETKTSSQQATKRRQFHIKNQWTRITDCDQIHTRTLVPSPVPPTDELPCHSTMLAAGASCYSFRNIFTCQSPRCPLPALSWANAQEVWNVMKAKDSKYTRSSDYIGQHPQLQYRMRAVLLDWIMEVCEVYRLHRETFFLATDFIDRYLSVRHNAQKYQLQLIGVTALFVAAKLEEIYPPKISEFAYITDGACSESDIQTQEIIMLSTLNWDLCPLTINMWMSVYLNIVNETTSGSKETCLTKLNYSRHSFLQISRLMDLAVLDEGALQYSYSIIAASILYHFSDEATTTQASGYDWSEIQACITWMAPLAMTVREADLSPDVRFYSDIAPDDHQNIQTHDVTISLLDQAKQRQKLMAERASPNLISELPVDCMLTPPPTKHKHSAAATATATAATSSDHQYNVSDRSTSSQQHGTSSQSVTSDRSVTSDQSASVQSSLDNLHLAS